jgi:hypothetical protein
MACSVCVPDPRFLSPLLIGILSALIGCGPGLPRVYPVKGTVVIKGKGHVKDLAGYNVQFQSVTDLEEMPGGRIEEDGTFTLYTRVGGKAIPGVKEGTYRACLLPPILEGGGSPPLVIPPRYTKFETAKLQYDITPGPNNLTIEVERSTR